MGSFFAPENLMREARRQKRIPEGQVPQVCVLDPYGDIVRNLLSANRSRLNLHWACYHTRLYDFECDGIGLGVIGCAVGTPFAVLVAEEPFSSGCRLLVSITSSGLLSRNQG
jgi:uridine phosphorylase